jgi:hypothetical protein
VLVDLAGSERLNSTGNTGEAALKETGAINRSLFTLGQVRGCCSTQRCPVKSRMPCNVHAASSTPRHAQGCAAVALHRQVLAALSVRGGIGGSSHVPYRDCKLTQLLWDGLRCVSLPLRQACSAIAATLDCLRGRARSPTTRKRMRRAGGRVLMLACLCPLKAAADESLNTLHFASMALRIKSVPVIMVDPQVADEQ